MSMLKHCSRSSATWQSSVGRIRTNATNVLTQSMAENRRHLTFRNARAHIRIFPWADFGGTR